MVKYDVVVVGSGMGGLSGALVLASQGYRVLVLEANYLPGGCCSSYWRKGRILETGATTLMGFDAGQPLDLLQRETGFSVDLKPIDPAMTVHLDGHRLVRWRDRDRWLEEVIAAFGQGREQSRLWKLLFELSDFVWKVAGKNFHFPPQNLGDLWAMARTNSPLDVLKLRWAFRSTASVLRSYGLAGNRGLRRFIDEQLMITAQATAEQTPFLFAAPALCYTHYTNFYAPGGLISLPAAVIERLGQLGGSLELRQRVTRVEQTVDGWRVHTENGACFATRAVLSNLPIWNLPELTEGSLRHWAQRQADRFTEYWSAFTMSVVIDDVLPPESSLHHQLILPEGQTIPRCGSHSVFVSISDPSDRLRCAAGERVLALSTHAARPADWFALDRQTYTAWKAEASEAMLDTLERQLPGFSRAAIRYRLDSSPATWQDWIFRHRGSVGGLPQRMGQLLGGLLAARTPFRGLVLCGDTVYPGQGVPGVVLGGLIAARRLREQLGQPLPPVAWPVLPEPRTVEAAIAG